MRIGSLSLLALLVLVGVIALSGCGGGDGGGNGNGGTVTGEVYGAVGGSFVPLGGQVVAIGSHTATSQTGTGRFTITGVPAGDFTIEVRADPGFGEVLNPERLEGTVVAGGAEDVGRILLGERPPEPA
jgi:hypothetical protein